MPVTITRTPWIDDDGTGTTGTILNNAAKTQLYDQIDGALAQVAPAADGQWVATPFNAAHYQAAGGGTWTVDGGAVIVNRYTIIGKTMIWSLYLSWFSGGNTIAGAVTSALITIPAGKIGSTFTFHRQYGVPGGAIADVEVTGQGSYIQITPTAGGNIPAGAFGLICTITFEIQ